MVISSIVQPCAKVNTLNYQVSHLPYEPDMDPASPPSPPYAADFAEIKGQKHVKGLQLTLYSKMASFARYHPGYH
jgi:hypothetical protein